MIDISEQIAGYVGDGGRLGAKNEEGGELRMLSLFSGCGGMDIGFEGGFICHRKSVPSHWVERSFDDKWCVVSPTRFRTVFADDILEEAREAWCAYMGGRRGHDTRTFHKESVVDLVKLHNQGVKVFPEGVDIVTGGFPCQDFSVAGKRRGFESNKDHTGKVREEDIPSEETRGKLYFWMKQVIDIVKPKMFVAENVKGLVNLGDVKQVIQKDFRSADGDGYIVLDAQVLHAADYGVPESRERVIFIGIRKDALLPEALTALVQETVPADYYPYPSATHAYTRKGEGLLPPVSCRDVFEGLEEPEVSADYSQRCYSKAKYMGAHCQGQTEVALDGIGPTIRSEHHGNIEFRRLSAEHGGRNADELSAQMPERRLTPRECAMIQTFPPDYPFVRPAQSGRGFALSASGAYKVIGNAVPPVLGYNIARRIDGLWDSLFAPADGGRP